MKLSLVAFGFSMVLVSFNVSSSFAATVTVCNETNLRAALSGGGTVLFGCDGTIVLGKPLTIATNTILDGNGRTVTISGNNAIRVFYVNPGVQFTVRNVTIANGTVIGTNSLVAGAPGENAFGAGIYNRGALTVIDCRLTQHATRGGKGGPPVLSTGIRGGPGGMSGGAAIYNESGTLWCTGTVFLANSATGGMGNNGSGGFDLGNGGHAFGGALFSRDGNYALSGVRFQQNAAQGGAAGGGGLNFGIAGSALGGAIYSLTATGSVFDVRFSSNTAFGASVSFNGGSGAGTGGAMAISNGVVTIDRSTFSESVARAGSNARHGSREPGSGGAIATSGTLTVRESVFARNSALALPNGTYGSPAQGGAIDNSGNLSIIGCTFSGNLARGGDSGGAASISGWPAGIAEGGAIRNLGDLGVTNCTFAGNLARGGDRAVGFSGNPGGDGSGGAIANFMSMTLTHVTAGSNSAVRGSSVAFPAGPGLAGGVYSKSNVLSILQNSLLAGNMPGSNGFGPLIDQGNNLSSDASCQFTALGSLNNTDPRLSPLDEFGGPTPTMALLGGSSAINAALAAYCPATDQRGVARPFGAACDIGAFESAPPYSIRGIIHGHKPTNGFSVSAGSTSTTSDSTGMYILFGLAPGTQTVTPSSPDAVCIPNSRSLDLASDMLGVDFKAYRINALTVDSFSNQTVNVVYAGASGQVREVQRASGLGGSWTPYATNTVGPNGVFTLDVPVDGTALHHYLRARDLAP
jgi:hypothetical protein